MRFGKAVFTKIPGGNKHLKNIGNISAWVERWRVTLTAVPRIKAIYLGF